MKDDIIIHTREEWGAVNVSENFERNPALGIVIHNMENANRTPESDSTAELVIAFQKSRDCQHDQMHRPKPFSDTGQNFTISRGGVVMEGRKGSIDAAHQGKVSRGAHASGVTHFNKHFHGIELEGDFRQSLQITAQQKDALINLCAHLRLWVENSPDSEWQVVPHAEVLEGHTDCPGKLIDHMDGVRVGIRARINELLLGTEGDGGVPQADKKVLKSTILRDNDVLEGVAAGHLVLRTTGREVAGIGPVQDALNFLAKANPALGIELGRFRGFFGEKTENAVEAFQQAAGLDVDGRIGEDDIKALDAAVVAAAGDGGFQRSVDVLGDDEMLQPAPDATPVGDPEPFATKGSKGKFGRDNSETTGSTGQTIRLSDGSEITTTAEHINAVREGKDLGELTATQRRVKKDNVTTIRQAGYAYKGREFRVVRIAEDFAGFATGDAVEKIKATRFGKFDRQDGGTGSEAENIVQTNSDVWGASVKKSRLERVFKKPLKDLIGAPELLNAMVEVFNPKTKKFARIPLVDVGPREDLEAELDLTFSVDEHLGNQGSAQVLFRIV